MREQRVVAMSNLPSGTYIVNMFHKGTSFVAIFEKYFGECIPINQGCNGGAPSKFGFQVLKQFRGLCGSMYPHLQLTGDGLVLNYQLALGMW